MTTEIITKQKTQVQKLQSVLSADSVQQQFQNALQENSSLFVASLIDVYGSDHNLQKCPANLVIMEALKAATLKLPINKGLGFAYIVPYKTTPQFQIGYKGYIQLAMRTGQYRYINADKVFEGELIGADKLTGAIDLTGDKTSDKVIGYFAHLETLNGFRKTVYMTADQMYEHGKRYSKSFSYSKSAWTTNFDEMGIKTMIRQLLGKYGILSVEIIHALESDTADDNLQGFNDDPPVIEPLISEQTAAGSKHDQETNAAPAQGKEPLVSEQTEAEPAKDKKLNINI